MLNHSRLRNLVDAKIIVLNDLLGKPEDLSSLDIWPAMKRLEVYETLVQLQCLKDFKMELLERGLLK